MSDYKTFRVGFGSYIKGFNGKLKSYIEIHAIDEIEAEELVRSMFGDNPWYIDVQEVDDDTN